MSDRFFTTSDDFFGDGFGGGIFENFFGQGNSRRSRSSRKSEMTYIPFGLSLEDCYKGKKTKLMIKKKVACKKCRGSGSKSGRSYSCSTCRGKGRVIRVQQIGPGLRTQVQAQCDDCGGKGESVDYSDRCPECEGNKVISSCNTVEVTFPPGSCQDSCITLRGEGDQLPGMEAGDIVIKVDQKPHDTYRCERGDLIMNKTVTMSEAICGAKFPVQRLDGSCFYLHVNKIIKNDDIRIVKNEGMPPNDGPRGNLYISFTVEYPPDNFASESDLLILKKHLNKNFKPEKECNESDAVLVQMDNFVQQTRCSGGTQSDDEQDDERGRFHGQSHTTQCTSQ